MSNNHPVTLSHSLVFPEVMREPALCQCFLETVLGIKIRKLVFVEKEKDMKESRLYHGIRLDVYVEDDADSVYNVEMQNTVESMKRVRYYQSRIDRQVLAAGEHYSKMKTSFVIMVCNYDPARAPKDSGDPASRETPGLAYPMYKRESVIACPVGTAVYEDGSHAIFLNTKYDRKYRADMPEVCEFLDLVNEPRDVPPEELEFPLGKMTAEGITRFRNNEKKMEEVVTLEEYVRDLEFKAREEGEARVRKELEAKAKAKVAKEKARADAAEAEADAAKAKANAAEAEADAAKALVAELQAQIATLKAAVANP